MRGGNAGCRLTIIWRLRVLRVVKAQQRLSNVHKPWRIDVVYDDIDLVICKP